MFSRFLSHIKLSYQDPLQEKEYCELRIPLKKEFFKILFGCLTMFFIPLTVRYYLRNLFPQIYMGIGALVVCVIIFLFRGKLLKYMKVLSIVFVSYILVIGIWNINTILVLPSNIEAFYIGYTYALVQKMLDFRATNFWVIFGFNVICTIFKFCLIGPVTVDHIILILCLEVFPIILSYKSEQSDRSLFDSLFKSKNQLLKFKQLLKRYLPNPIAIFAQDFTQAYFVNNSFKRSFNTVDITLAKRSLEGLVLDIQDYEKNKELLTLVSDEQNQKEDMNPLTLAGFMKLLIAKKELIKNQVISVQVVENNPSSPPAQEYIEGSKGLLKTQSQDQYLYGVERFGTVTQQDKTFTIPGFQSEESFVLKRDHSSKMKEKNEFQQTLGLNRTKIASDAVDDIEFTFKPKEEKAEKDQEPKKRVFKVKIFSLTWDGNEAIALILDDVTHERTIMELKIAAKNKDLVIATVSHELRTPLNGVLGLLEIMKKIVNQPEVMTYVTACKSNCRLLLNLVNSILDLSQIENKKLRLVYSKVSIGDLLGEIRTLFDHFCQIKGLYLEIYVDPNVSKTIVTDQIRLSQILINLLGNAFKFTFKGGIDLRLEADSENPYRIKFSVKDTGIGIKRENQDKLFKLFGRLEQQDKKINTQGVGLGLTISNTLAMLLDPVEKKGIQVESEFGKGTTFSFVIQSVEKVEVQREVEENSSEINEEQVPFVSVNDKINRYFGRKEVKVSFVRSPVGVNPRFEGKSSVNLAAREANMLRAYGGLSERTVIRNQTWVEKVSVKTVSVKCENIGFKDQGTEDNKMSKEEGPWCLVVDDNPFNLIVAINLMKETGYQVRTAMNGQEAINIVEEYTGSGMYFKVILMDCQMPVMDGYEATRVLRRMMNEGKVRACPIIALTANNQDEDHEKLCTNAGMSGCVAKPLRVKDLDEIIKKAK